VSESIDLVVHCARTPQGPRVAEVVAVEDLASAADAAQFTITPLFARSRSSGRLAWTGNLPVRAERALRDAGVDLRALLDTSADRNPVDPSGLDGHLIDR
jgi:hypothetical protein